MLFYLAFHLEDDMLSTISTGVMGVVGLMMVFRTSKPFNTLRIVMMSFLIAAFAVCYFFFPTYFTIEPLNTRGLLVFIVFALLAARSSGRCAALACGSRKSSCTANQSATSLPRRRSSTQLRCKPRPGTPGRGLLY